MERLYSTTTLEEFPRVLMDAVTSVISCLHLSFDEINLVTGEVRHQLSCDLGLDEEEFMARWSHFAHEHPVIAHAAGGNPVSTFALDDFITRRQLRATGLYKNIFEPCGFTAQIGGSIPVKGRVVGFVLDRESTFSDRERQLLDLFYPHILRAHFNARVFSSLRQQQSVPPDFLAWRRCGLTRRECETLRWLAEGKRDGEIAVILNVSARTINHHVASILRKLGVETRTTAAARAWELLRCQPPSAGAWATF